MDLFSSIIGRMAKQGAAAVMCREFILRLSCAKFVQNKTKFESLKTSSNRPRWKAEKVSSKLAGKAQAYAQETFGAQISADFRTLEWP